MLFATYLWLHSDTVVHLSHLLQWPPKTLLPAALAGILEQLTQEERGGHGELPRKYSQLFSD